MQPKKFECLGRTGDRIYFRATFEDMLDDRIIGKFQDSIGYSPEGYGCDIARRAHTCDGFVVEWSCSSTCD